MKKLLLLLSVLLLCATACAEDFPTFAWERDGLHHWQLDAAGAVINQGAHETGNGWICAVCAAEIIDWGDGSYDVTDYDAYGNTIRHSSFEVDGQLYYESIHVLTYNEDGVVLLDQEYVGGKLFCNAVYTVNAAGEQIPVSLNVWYEDGTSAANTYDEYGNCTCAVTYDENGALDVETIREFALTDDGYFYECKYTTRFASGETFSDEINQYGDTIHSYNTEADGTPWSDCVYEHEYRDGEKLWTKQYEFGVLTFEQRYNEDGICVEETEYLEDGCTLVHLYDDWGDSISATTYAADGSVVTVRSYEFIYDDERIQQEVRIYDDGVLTEHTIYLYDENGDFTGATETTYHADGTRTVLEYNDWMAHIRTTVYAADGSIISEENIDYDDIFAFEEEE